LFGASGNVLTNGGGEYTITVPTGMASNSPVNRKQLYDLLEERSVVTLYGATNTHPSLAGAGSLVYTSPSTSWAITNAALADGTNWVADFFTTNATTLIRAGSYIGRFYAVKSGNKTANAVMQLLVCDTATTNVLDTSAISGEIGTALASYRLHNESETNVTGTALYLGVRYGIVVSGSGTAPTVTTYGGDPYDTHLETPGFGPVGGYITDGQSGVSLSGTTTLTNLVVNGAMTNMLPLVGITNIQAFALDFGTNLAQRTARWTSYPGYPSRSLLQLSDTQGLQMFPNGGNVLIGTMSGGIDFSPASREFYGSDGTKLLLLSSGDTQSVSLWHDGTDGHIRSSTGAITIETNLTVNSNLILPGLPTTTNGFTTSGTIWNSNGYLCVWSP
jgi:hypothetical protein